uniref:Uncharacterized protein n=1 Tax=Meloidogyne incognita TaxID=6306 RepID=A0A914LNV3_MELIC
MERRLTVYVLVTFLGQLIVSLFMVTWFSASAAIKPFVNTDTYNLINFAVQNQSPWVNDISTIALPAWLMLWANERLHQSISYSLNKAKENILHFFRLKKKSIAVGDLSQHNKLFVQKPDGGRRFIKSVSFPESTVQNRRLN